MKKARVPSFDKPSTFVVVENGATVGAVFGVNLRNPDGSLVTAAQFSSTGANFTLSIAYAHFVPLTRTINTTAPLAGGGSLANNLTLTTSMATDRLIGRDTTGTGVMEEITVGGGVEFNAAGGIQTSAFTGSVVKAAGSTVTTLNATGVTPGTYSNPDVVVGADGRISLIADGPPPAGGTVTSVGLALPASLFSVSGSPATTTGTLTGALANQSANLVFAGPSSGGAAPTFRSLVEADTTLSDITTNNASTSAHGYLKKLSNVATEYMDGTGNWSVPAGGGGGGGGAFESTSSSTSAVITSTTIPVDNTIPQNTEGAAYTDLNVTITPTDAGSDLLVTIFFPYVTASASVGFRIAVFRDSGANAVWAGFASVTTSSHQIMATFVVPSTSTSATTFTLRLGTSSGSVYINRDSAGNQYFGGVFKAIMAVKEML